MNPKSQSDLQFGMEGVVYMTIKANASKQNSDAKNYKTQFIIGPSTVHKQRMYI
jgi:hypothetical protein